MNNMANTTFTLFRIALGGLLTLLAICTSTTNADSRKDIEQKLNEEDKSMAPNRDMRIHDFLRAVAQLGVEAKVSELRLLEQIVGRPISLQRDPRSKLGGSSNTYRFQFSGDHGNSLARKGRILYVPGELNTEKASLSVYLDENVGCVRLDQIKAVLGEPSETSFDPPRHANIARRKGAVYSVLYRRPQDVLVSFLFEFKDCASQFGLSKNLQR
jgi:hypothetical protein